MQAAMSQLRLYAGLFRPVGDLNRKSPFRLLSGGAFIRQLTSVPVLGFVRLLLSR